MPVRRSTDATIRCHTASPILQVVKQLHNQLTCESQVTTSPQFDPSAVISLPNSGKHCDIWRSCRPRQSSSIGIQPLVVIRKAAARDAGAIYDVLKAAVTPLVDRIYTRSQIDAWIADEAPDKLVQGIKFGTVLIAESDRRIVGFSRLSGAEVEALYVHPAYAGRSVGNLLLATLEKFALVGKVDALSLDAVLSAVAFYESAGYEVIGPSMPLFDNGVSLPCVRMQKILASMYAKGVEQHEKRFEFCGCQLVPDVSQ